MKFSRHAKNRLRLYNITENDVEETINSPDTKYREGDMIIAVKRFQGRFSDYPLKVVYKNENGFLIITAYPLKKSYRRKKNENTV